MKIRLKIFFIIIIYLYSGLAVSAIPQIKGMRIWPSPESVRIVFDLTKPVSYKVYTLSNPARVVIDFYNVALATKLSEVSLANTPIRLIRYGKHQQQKLRVVFETKKTVNPNSFALKPNKIYGHRVVLDLESSEKQAILALFDLDAIDDKKHAYIAPTSKDFTIAIDAGHGGDDPGAIGPRGTKEKDVSLAIARYLKKMVNREKGMRAMLIRNGDYYIGLRERMQRARNKNVDLFISIHADAYKSPKAAGASVFILSSQGASSEAAKWLAEAENKADMIGGVSLQDKSDLLTSVLLDLSQTANRKASLEAARHVLRSLSKTTYLHKNHVERAGFAVLKAPDVPSFLVETGFISNPKTELKLRNKKYQQKIASSIMVGIRKYFSGKHHRVLQHVPKLSTKTVSTPKYYKIKPGDSLSKIASKYNMSIDTLKSLNRLRGDKILVGQKIIIEK